MDQKDHLPLYGVGPIYVYGILLLTAGGTALAYFGKLPTGYYEAFHLPVNLAAALLMFFGVTLWVRAVVQSKIDKNIKENWLVTTSVYAWVRNPIYAAFLFLCTGVLLLAHNFWLLVLPPVYWAFLTVLMKHTEEKWLLAHYGAEYQAYCRRTNRCIPWFPKR